MKAIRNTFVLLAFALAGVTTTQGQDPSTSLGTGPLPSWNDGKTKQSITEFVGKVTKEGSADFVPPNERIATFDNDGTLWCEKPMPIQLFFALDRVKTLAPQHPEWKTKEPFASLLKGDVKGAMAGGEHALLEIVAATHTGMTVGEFEKMVQDWIATAKHPITKQPFTEMVYLPMVELLTYLRENGFKTFIVSGGGIEFMRPWTEKVYGIPPEQVVGSSGKTKYEIRDGQPVLVKLPEINFIDDKEGKPVGINQHIGRKPILSVGNVFSGGDIAMLRYCQSHPGATLQLMVNHDDAAREFAYAEPDNASLKAAATNGWTVVNMKNDWKTIFAFEKK
jgi:haloacid dehalogenase-like hydrolase